MKSNKLLFTFFLFVKLINYSSAQFCTSDDRFTNAEYFSDNQIESLTDVTYGNAVDWQDNSEVLKLDYYYPSNTIDTMTKRPFILLIHGGGFSGGNKESMIDECMAFAKRGYVAATMSYRLGFDQSSSIDLIRAVYRADQDANAALRHIVENADENRIDTSWMFIGGSSAGSITSLFTSYVDQEEWEVLFPGIESSLGALETSGNNLTAPYSIKGIFNNYGAGSPYATKPDELKPMISFHGALDQVVPIGTGPEGLIGSQALHDLLISEGVCSDLTVDPTGGHVIYNSAEGKVFRVEKASCFFKSIFCDNCSEFYATDSIPASCQSIPSPVIETKTINETVVYPNPFNDQLNFTDLEGNEYYYLYDSLGRKVFEGEDIQSQYFGHLITGIYTLTIQKDNRVQALKLCKE